MRTVLLYVSLLAVSASVGAQDLSFDSDTLGQAPAGWAVAESGTDGFAVTVESDGPARALRIARVGDGQYAAIAARADSLLEGAVAVRLAGSLRADSVRGLSGLWLRFEDADGSILAFENAFESSPFIGTRGWTATEIVLPVPPGAEKASFGALLGGDGTLWIDSLRIERITSADVAEPSPAALAYLGAALDSLEARSYHRASTDWPSVRARARTWALGAQTAAETYRALRMTAQSIDRHSGLYTPERAGDLRADPPSSEAGALPLPSAALLDDHVGYVSVLGFESVNERARRIYADALVAALDSLDAAGARTWVIDLRENGGGTMHPMLSGLGPLLGADPVGAFVEPDGSESPWVIVPPGGDRPTGPASVVQDAGLSADLASADAPVAVLVGPGTASSGEIVALAFRGRPRTVLVGTPTAGLTTGNEFVDLSDGAILKVTTSVYADRTGRTYGGEIEPDLAVEDSDEALRVALQWLADALLLHERKQQVSQ